MAGPVNKGGRPRGAKKYKNDVLINIIAGVLPNGQYGWDQVAAAYMTAAKENVLHDTDTDNLKRHWVKTLCNGIKKPTGGTREKGERIHKRIAIKRLILDKTHSGILGLSLDGDADSKDGCSGSGSDTSFNKYSAKVVPSPPPPVEDTTSKNKDDEGNELAGIELARIDSLSTTDPPAVTTSRPPSRTTGAKPESHNSTSLLKNQKTKNSLNKNKDRTSIAGSIAKLDDSLSTNTDKGEDVIVAKRMPTRVP